MSDLCPRRKLHYINRLCGRHHVGRQLCSNYLQQGREDGTLNLRVSNSSEKLRIQNSLITVLYKQCDKYIISKLINF